MSAKGEGSTGRSPGVTLGGGRRVHQLARPRSNAWLWILNAVVIGFVIIAAFLASTKIGHTVAGASYHFALYYMGVLALVALTAEVGIGLVCTDRIFMRPAGRVTMQAIHRATGFGAIAFLISHIILEIMAQRSTVLDSIIPFLYPSGSKSFYLGLGTLASDMFILIMVIGVYRARLATRMSPAAWRVLHASAYVAWIFGLVHGLLAGRPAKAFFGYEGFVYWSYGFCVVAVALALVVRFVAKDRARNELSDQMVAEPPPGASLSSAAAISSMGMSGSMSAAALGGGPHSAGALESGRPGAAARGGRTQLALPAGKGSASGRTGQFTATGRLGQTTVGQTARFGRTGGFDQFGPDHPSGPLPQVDQFGQQFGADHPSGPLPQVGRPLRNQPAVTSGQRDWHAAYERPMGVRRPDTPAPRYEQTGEIDRSGAYQQQHPSGAYPQQHPSGAYPQQHPSGAYPQQRPSGAYPQQLPPGAYGSSTRPVPTRSSTRPRRIGSSTRPGRIRSSTRPGRIRSSGRPAHIRSSGRPSMTSVARRHGMSTRLVPTCSRARPSTSSVARRRATTARPTTTGPASTGRRLATRPTGPASSTSLTAPRPPPRTTARARTPRRTSTGRRRATTGPGRTPARPSTSPRWATTWPLRRPAVPTPGRRRPIRGTGLGRTRQRRGTARLRRGTRHRWRTTRGTSTPGRVPTTGPPSSIASGPSTTPRSPSRTRRTPGRGRRPPGGTTTRKMKLIR